MFRSNEEPFLVCSFPNGYKSIIRLKESTIAALTIAVIGIMGPEPEVFQQYQEAKKLFFHIIREEKCWKITDNRDVEELAGNSTQREEIHVRFHSGDDENTWAPLRQFPLPRSWVPCCGPVPNIPIFQENALDGAQIVQSLATNGYFRIQFTPETVECIKRTFESTKEFFAQPQEYKNQFSGSTTGRLAPFFDYRSTSLSKEFFVFRNTELFETPNELKALLNGFLAMGNLLKNVMQVVFEHLGWEQEDIDKALSEMIDPVTDQQVLLHSSFTEVFRYDCSPSVELPEEPRYRISCGEHRDTSLLTIIPKFEGVCEGLEVYNWGTGQWHCEEECMKENEAIVFAGELFAEFTKSNITALCHRVIVPLSPGGVRYSCPFELLPYPTPEVRQLLSELAKGLVSVNY